MAARNGKSTGKRKPEAKAKAAKPKKIKQTAEQMSDIDRQKLLFRHKNIIKPLLAEKKSILADISQAFEIAKKDGIPKKDIDFAILCETGDGLAKINVDLERMHRIARWSGVGKQLELFGGKDDLTKMERLFEDGRIAALNDHAPKPPDHLSQKDAQQWLEGHAAGRTSLNTSRSTNGFTKLGDTAAASDLVDRAESAADIPTPPLVGTEPATHHVN